MKNICFPLALSLCLLTVFQSIAQSRSDIERYGYKQTDQSSVPIVVLSSFYKEHPDINDVVYSRYISPADSYQISFIEDGKIVDTYYTDDVNGDFKQVLSGYYLTWNELPGFVKTRLDNAYKSESLTEFYIINNNGEESYYALREIEDNRALVECDANGRLSSRIVYDAEKAAKREGRFHPIYKTSYNLDKKHIADYIFAYR
jgi:hypothetical protein